MFLILNLFIYLLNIHKHINFYLIHSKLESHKLGIVRELKIKDTTHKSILNTLKQRESLLYQGWASEEVGDVMDLINHM